MPFYVGKGCGNRYLSHYKANNLLHDNNIHKKNLILKLNNGGFLPKYIILNKNSSEKDALDNEIYIISWIKSNIGDILTNITDGGDNPPIHYGLDNNKSVKVYQYDKDTGEFIQEFNCIRDACRAMNVSLDLSCHITDCCRGNRRTCNSYIWKYEKLDKVTPDSTKFGRIKFNKLIAYNDVEEHIFKSMKEAYSFLGVPNKGKIN